MIQHGYELDFSKQTFGVILYGAPGIGKTTLALSDGNGGADTLLIDLEHGIGRTNPVHRMNASVLSAATYEEVLADLNTPEAFAAKTIVIDTAGSLVDYLKDWAMRTKSDARQKNGAFNGLKGFGYVKSELESFVNKIKVVMNKNVVFIFHCDEKADKDGNPIQRLRCEGSFRNTVWTGIDFGAYIQMIGNKRYACFTPEDEFFAKGCHGIEGHVQIPQLKDDVANDFLKKLFDSARKNMVEENAGVAEHIAKYQKIIDGVKEMVEGVKDADTANACLKAIGDMDHALTSKKECGKILTDKAKTLGLIYSKAAGAYVAGDPA
jgi:hypothetical protein